METQIIDTEKHLGSVSVYGDLDRSTSPTLLKEIDNLIEEGTLNIILIFSEIEFISSSGIGVISDSIQKLVQKDGKLIVVCDSRKISSLFDITNLSKFITTYKTVDEAIASF